MQILAGAPSSFSDIFSRHYETKFLARFSMANEAPGGNKAATNQRRAVHRLRRRTCAEPGSCSLLLELTPCVVRFVSEIEEGIHELFLLADEEPVVHEALNRSDGSAELSGSRANDGNGL